MSELERALEFLALADHGGTRRQPFAYGTALFDERAAAQAGTPTTCSSSGCPTTSAPPSSPRRRSGFRAEAGLRHRKLELRDEEAGARLEPQFRGLGWTVNRHVLMALHREPDRSPDRSLVREVDAEALREPRAEQLRGYDWAADAGGPRPAPRREDALRRGVETRFFAVLDDGSRRQLDGPLPRRRHRPDRGRRDRRERPRARLRKRRDASRRRTRPAARARSCVFLVADDEDWPKELYRKLGFDELGRVYEFLLARPRAPGTNEV